MSPLMMLELGASRQKPPSDQRIRVLAAPASSMPARSWRRLALRAGRRWRGRSALPAPAASPISASHYALGARRTALVRAEGAARLCRAAPGGTAAGCHRRLALRARRRWRGRCAPGRLRCASRQKPPSVSVCWLRQHASSQLAPPRATRSAPMAWALRARAPACAPAYGRWLLVVGMSLLKTPCASRCSRRLVQGALRAPAEGEGGEGCFRHHHARACGGTCVLPQHVQCESARRATATEAPYPQARPTPRTLSARARLHAA